MVGEPREETVSVLRVFAIAMIFTCAVLAQSSPPARSPQQRNDLETQKLRAEIDKLQIEIRNLKEAADSRNKLEAEKLGVEILKLRTEIVNLRNSGSFFPGILLGIVQALGLGTLVAGGLALLAGKKLQDAQFRKLNQDRDLTQRDHELQSDKLRQELENSRREHDLGTFKALGEGDPRIRIGAVSVLAQRVHELNEKQPHTEVEKQQRTTIIRVLIAVTKHEDTEEIQKYIADHLVEVLGARVDAGSPPQGTKSPMAAFDFQGARLTNAWWQNVDLRGVDLYKAKLPRAGLAGSFLQEAVLKNADLSSASLSNSSAGAAHTQKVNLEGAILT